MHDHFPFLSLSGITTTRPRILVVEGGGGREKSQLVGKQQVTNLRVQIARDGSPSPQWLLVLLPSSCRQTICQNECQGTEGFLELLRLGWSPSQSQNPGPSSSKLKWEANRQWDEFRTPIPGTSYPDSPSHFISFALMGPYIVFNLSFSFSFIMW